MTHEDLARRRAAQGFPPTVEDPVILAQVAAILIGEPGGVSSPPQSGGTAEAAPRTATRQSHTAGTTRPTPKGATHESTPLG